MPVNRENRFLLLYGSQTGQAKAIAEEIAEKAVEQNLHADIHCLTMTEKKFYIEREKCVVIVTSTTGDGEPPDTAVKFVRRLKKKTLPGSYLSHLSYALLGLGDSNYTNFCNCGKSLDKRLQDLGAKHFYSSGWADDAVGLEVAVEPWIDGLWAALKKQLYGVDSDSDLCAQSREIRNSDIQPELLSSINLNNTNSLQNGINSAQADITTDFTDRDPESKESNRTTGSNLHTVEQTTDLSLINNIPQLTSFRIDKTNIFNTEVTDNLENNKESDRVTEKLSNLVLTDQSKGLDSLTASEISSDFKTTVQLEDSSSNVNQSCHTAEPEISLCKSCAAAAQTSKETDIISGLSGIQDVHGVTVSVSPDVPSIRHSVAPLSESNLSVPVLSPAYLRISYNSSLPLKVPELPLQNGCPFPSAASPVAMATMVSAVTMTTEDAVKKAMMVKLDISECNIQYEPGDSFSVICPNNAEEVNSLLQRLGVEETGDVGYQLSILPDTKKRNAALPKHVPETGTLRDVLTTCLDIREPPKKALLRVLVEYTTDPGEKRRLQELCSRQGSSDYAQFIREPSLSLIDILSHFRSCSPPVDRIIEHLPRLQPRPYSICSSPLVTPKAIDFLFNVVEIDDCDGRTYCRKGVCTGWLEQFEGMSENIQVPVFARTSQYFHLPGDVTTPVIMVGPGTGVAPFLGFLKHRAALLESLQGQSFGEAWLFYGCRNERRDFLFRTEFEDYLKTGNLTRLCVSFSRDEQPADSPKYVQDNIRGHGTELVELIDNSGAVVYVCGDAKNMARDVNQAFIDIFSTVKGLSEDEAKKYVMQLRLHKRYLEDVWT